eukprot:Colp12_sorted_trinity150504_noHs@14277
MKTVKMEGMRPTVPSNIDHKRNLRRRQLAQSTEASRIVLRTRTARPESPPRHNGEAPIELKRGRSKGKILTKQMSEDKLHDSPVPHVHVPLDVKLRQMELKDVAKCFHLGEKVFTAQDFPNLFRTWDQYEIVESLSGERELCLVAEVDDSVVGFLLASTTVKKKDTFFGGYVSWVAVSRPFQRRGIGTKLVTCIVERLREQGTTTILADTQLSNTAAINFFAKLGFSEPVEHVYMSQNISKHDVSEQQEEKETKKRKTNAHGRKRTNSTSQDGKHHHSVKTSVKIREMEVDDLYPVFALGESVFTAKDFPNLYRTWDECEVMDLFDTDSETCIVAEEDGEIVGFALGTVISKARCAWTYGYLIWLGVSSTSQRGGVGRKLYEAFHDMMVKRDVRMLLIDTQADNTPAIKFFEKVGFSNREDHVYYTKRLQAQGSANTAVVKDENTEGKEENEEKEEVQEKKETKKETKKEAKIEVKKEAPAARPRRSTRK